MKRCPECRRDYFDDSLLYCLDDGALLLEGPGSIGLAYEPQTAILHSTDDQREAATVPLVQLHGTTDLSTKNRIWMRPVSAGLIVVLVLLAGYLIYRDLASVTKPNDISSIAVMPFANESGNADVDYLADGMTDALISSLSQLPGLTVKARSAVFRYKATDTDIKTVGADLNAQAILNGHVVGRGDQLTVTLELIDSKTENVLWAGRYERKVADLLAIQSDITRDVIKKLANKMSGTEERQATKAATSDPEAYRLLLQGRYFLDRTTKEDTEKALDYFQQALARDARCAVCWADVGRAYLIQAGHAWVPESEASGRAREAVNQALSIDPELAEGYAQLGRLQATYDLNIPAAEASYRRALDLAPRNASVQDGAAVLAYKLGRFDQAIDLSRQSLLEDPLNPAFYHNLGLTNLAAGKLPDAEQALKKALDLAPQRTVSHGLLSIVLVGEGRGDEAFIQAQQEPDEAWRLWATAIVGHRSGRKKDSDTALQKLIALNDESTAFQMAEVYAVRGDADYAFRWLETAYEKHDAGVTHAKVDPLLESLRSDPRWVGFMNKLGLG